MKYLIGIVFGLSCFFDLSSQVTVTSDLPSQVAKNKEIPVTMTFNKGPIKNYSKYEMSIPADISVKEIDCKYGAFSFESGKVRIIWAITPSEAVYTIKLNFVFGNTTGTRQIAQTYAYAEKGQKLELEMAKINFVVLDSIPKVNLANADTLSPVINSDTLSSANSNDKPVETNSDGNSATTESAATNNETAVNQTENTSKENDVNNSAPESKAAPVEKANSTTENTEVLAKENTEVKNETKEAESIGNEEKAKAELNISEAKSQMQKADSISDLEKKREAIGAANESMRKAESDLAAADRIITLSKSLNENNKQNESGNQNVDTTAKPINQLVNKANEPTTPGLQVNNNSEIKIDKAKENAMNKGAGEAKDLYKSISPEDHHDDPEIQMQVSQLRMDSRDAREVGTREKLKAEQSLHDAYDALKKTKYIPDAEEKKLAIEKANADIEQAKADLEIASKILTLSKSLEENAKEIERLHLGEDPKGVSTASTQSSKPAKEVISLNKPKPSVESTTVSSNPETKNNVVKAQKAESKMLDSVEKQQVVTSTESSKTAEPKNSKEVIASENNVAVNNADAAFTLQLGSFVNSPDMTTFKKLGKVDLRTENGRFKVYYGKFVTKQEASDMRQKTVAKGFDCFVVTLKK